MKLPHQTKILLILTILNLEYVTFILFFFHTLSLTVNLIFLQTEKESFSVFLFAFLSFCPQSSWLQMWPPIKCSRSICIHIAVLVITSVIWSFWGLEVLLIQSWESVALIKMFLRKTAKQIARWSTGAALSLVQPD